MKTWIVMDIWVVDILGLYESDFSVMGVFKTEQEAVELVELNPGSRMFSITVPE